SGRPRSTGDSPRRRPPRATGLPKCRAGQARSTTVRHDLTRRYKSREHTVRQQAVGPRARALAVGHERSERDGRTGRTGSATTAQAGTDPPGREAGPGDRAWRPDRTRRTVRPTVHRAGTAGGRPPAGATGTTTGAGRCTDDRPGTTRLGPSDGRLHRGHGTQYVRRRGRPR